MSTLTLLIASGGLFYATCLTPSKPFKKLEVDVTVQDEQGNPVDGAQILVSYLHWMARSPIAPLLLPFRDRTSPFSKVIIRNTDDQGKCKLRFITWSPGAQINITKNGWYSRIVTLKDRMPETSMKWTKEPQSIIARLRKRKNPVAQLLSNKKQFLDYPLYSEEPVGFDFIMEDWMPPYGKGEVLDAIIKPQTVIPKGPGTLSGILEIIFQGEDNGIQGIPKEKIFSESQLIYPHEAPEHGYTNQYFYFENFISRPSDRIVKTNLDANYFFIRLRTQKNEKDTIISAYYGIILYPIEVAGRNNWLHVHFPYFINLKPNDRNLEPTPNARGQIIP